MTKVLKIVKRLLLYYYKWIWELKSCVLKPRCRLCREKTTKRKGYRRSFLECNTCGFIYSGDFPEVIAQIGAGMSGSWGDAESGGEREDFLVRLSAEELGKKTFLLYGVGSTLAFPVLLSEGFDVYGCDVSNSVIEYRQKNYGQNKFFHIRDLNELKQKYDVIVACEVIEHFNNPVEAITNIVRSMTSDGIFCGTTNFYPGGSIEDGQTVGYMSLINHVAYWSERSFSHILNEFGLNLITFEMICPGSIKPDLKYNDLFPNKRVFFASADDKALSRLHQLKKRTPVLPIDLSDYPHPSYGQENGLQKNSNLS